MDFDSLFLVLSQVQVAPGGAGLVALMPRGTGRMRVEGRKNVAADHSMCTEGAEAQGEEQRQEAEEDTDLQPEQGAAERTGLRQEEGHDLVCSYVCVNLV